MNNAGSRIYIYIFTLLFIDEDSSALSEMSSVFECGGVGCGTTTEENSEDEVEPIKIPKRRKVAEDIDDEDDSHEFMTSGRGRSTSVRRGRGRRGCRSSEQGRGKSGRGGSAGSSAENRGRRGRGPRGRGRPA